MSVSAAERKAQTQGKIYRYIYHAQKICTKQSLAQDLGLSLPTIYQHLSELMERGLVTYSGKQVSTGGRKASGLAVVDNARFAVGASITRNRMLLSAADLRLHEMACRSVPHTFGPKIAGCGQVLAQEIEIFLDEYGLDRERLLGVGIAFPGVISPDCKKVVAAPTLRLRDVAVENLGAGIPYPVYIENDATCGGHAEWFMRSNLRNMAYLSLEDGVGGAVLVNGQNYVGDNRRSGEFGHMCVEPDGLPCKCGKQGCLEAYCSVRRISDDLGVSLESFFSGLERGNITYQQLWQDLLRHLAVGINSIRMVLDCEVILGGSLTEYLEPYLPQLKRYVVENNTFERDADFLHLSVLRRHAVPLGAALHFIESFLEHV